MTVPVQTILDNAAKVLSDISYDRYTVDDLLAWLNEGIQRTVALKPDSTATTSAMTPVTGTRQTIPANGNQLIKVTHNVVAGNPDQALNLVDIDTLNAFRPSWHIDPPADLANEYCQIENDPKSFYVYPPSTAVNDLEIVYSTLPAEVGQGDDIPLDDVFAPALTDYVVARSLATETDSQAYTRSREYNSSFLIALGLDSEVDKAASPAETSEAE